MCNRLYSTLSPPFRCNFVKPQMTIRMINTIQKPSARSLTRSLTLWLAFMLMASHLVAGEKDKSAFHSIMKNIQEDHLKTGVATAEKETAQWLKQIDEKGAFPDIDYTNRAQTVWEPLQHLNRVYSLAVAYTAESSRYKDNPEVFRAIVNALTYWYETHPTSTNWYMQQIACPQRVGIILILMRSGEARSTPGCGASPLLEQKLIGRMAEEGGRPDQKGSLGTAANKLDIATHWIYRGCLMEDEEILSFGVTQAYMPLQLVNGQGIQFDYSYHQHGRQLYIGGYGAVLVDNITKLAIYTQNTPFALPNDKRDLFCAFIRKAYIPAIRGKFLLYNVFGRSISRENAPNQTSFIPVLERLTLLDPDHASFYQESIDRIQQIRVASHAISPLHTHFWCSDYTLHQRPEYTFDVRMASTYTTRNENGNGENLKGFFLTDGATTLVKEGNEYENIFPVWDWSKIPGTTTPAVEQIPLPGAWEKPGTSTFAGGVSDGKYGVSAYRMEEKQFGVNTSARKSWFMFDDEIVCLGAGIQSDSPYSVCTTVNQCLLQDDVKVSDGREEKQLTHGKHHFKQLSWIKHQGIGYFFPEASDIYIESEQKTGSWTEINLSQSEKPVTKDVLKIWMEHGEKPHNAGYAYTIVPTQPNSGQIRYPSNEIKILKNTAHVQAVQHQGLDLLGIVFHEPGMFSCDMFSLETDTPCILLLSGIRQKEVKVYISDPSRSQDIIKIKACIPTVGEREFTFQLPVYPDPYSGSTHTYFIDTHNLILRTL